MKYFMLLLIPLFFISCITTTNERSVLRINSFTDPEFKNHKFKKVIINFQSTDFKAKNNTEKLINSFFEYNGIESGVYSDLILPTRNYTDEEVSNILKANDFSAVLFVDFESWEYHKTTLSDGEIIQKPSMTVNLKLIDLNTMKTAWIANGYNGGNAYESLIDITYDFLDALSNKMIKDSIVIIDKSKIKSKEKSKL